MNRAQTTLTPAKVDIEIGPRGSLELLSQREIDVKRNVFRWQKFAERLSAERHPCRRGRLQDRHIHPLIIVQIRRPVKRPNSG